VAQDEPGDDGADTVQLEQRRARRGDGVADAALGGGDVTNDRSCGHPRDPSEAVPERFGVHSGIRTR
jgi:hypothetical protein